ncbi:MAG: HI0074 family nucleotidyltransferase substrate-binding subunit [Candidatus Pacebacteria bacterium]|nr:HI0074 family nucleotidyltransferase substrate-binding subunit [Candidatus Paceibacterota bacterium]
MNNEETVDKQINELDSSLASLIESFTALEEANGKNIPESWTRSMSAGVIKNFEFTFGVATKLIISVLRLNLATELVGMSSFKNDMILASDNGIIDDANTWLEWRKFRNRTSHIYSQEMSIEILSHINRFISDTQTLAARIKKYRGRDSN